MPASSPQIAVRISAKADEFSAAIASLRKDLASLPGQAERSSRGAAASISRYAGAAPDIGRLTSGFGALSNAMRAVPGLGAVAGIGGVAGIGEMVTRFAASGVELQNTARMAGMSTESLNGLRGAMRLVGGSAGDMDAAMTGFNRTLSAARFGANPAATGVLGQLEISMRDSAGNARSSRDMFLDLADHVSQLNNPAAQEQAVNALGLPSSVLPLMLRGRRGIEDLDRRVQRIYGSMGDFRAASQRASEATAELGLHADKLGMTITSRLGPPMAGLLDNLSRFVEKHDRDIGDVFGNLGKAVENVDWRRVGTGFEAIGSGISFATRNATLLTASMEALAANWVFRSLFGRGIIGALATPAGAVVATGLAAGGAAGAMNTPLVDDYGRPIGNWGGAEGERNARAAAAAARPMPSSRMTGGWEYGGEALPTPGAKPTSRETEERLRIGRNILMGLGRTREQAAGIMAGLLDESGLNPTAVGDSGQAYGIGQHHPSRRRAIEAHFGRSMVGMSFEDQVRAVDWEMRSGGERAAGDRIASSRTAAEAGYNMRYYYERPLNQEGDARHTAAVAASLGRRWEADPPNQAAPATEAPRPTPAERLGALMRDDPASSPKPPEGATHNIVVDFNNMPQAATVRLNSQGAGSEITGLNIKRAMPHADVGAFNPLTGP